MSSNETIEFWLAGPVTGVIQLLQPVAHAILQSRREITGLMQEFPEDLLWQKPGGVASVAFHLQHIPGVLDRLFTYASGQPLSPGQMEYLQKEGNEDPAIHVNDLLGHLNENVDLAIARLKETPATTLLETRFVGRKQLPSNTLGLLFHAAEHMQRHTGQLLVTVNILLHKK